MSQLHAENAPLLYADGGVLASVDASPYLPAVAALAGWAAARLGAGLEFVHVTERGPEAPTADLSGALGLGGQEALLAELAAVDEARGRLAHQRGRLLLEQASVLARAEAPAVAPASRLRHGALAETLLELEAGVRLFVMGKRSEHAGPAGSPLGGQLERVVRSVHRPVLVAARTFAPVRRAAIAFDGSATGRRIIGIIAASPLLAGLPLRLVSAGDSPALREAQAWARATLEAAGFAVETLLQPGDPEAVIGAAVDDGGADLLVMGAYGHSRIRQWIVGSTTTAMLMRCRVPVLLLRGAPRAGAGTATARDRSRAAACVTCVADDSAGDVRRCRWTSGGPRSSSSRCAAWDSRY
jgi:nucleotide-binding universal stress UspA family protein